MKNEIEEKKPDNMPQEASSSTSDTVIQKKLNKEPQFTFSNKLPGWLQENNMSLGFTTYQMGKVYLVGQNPQNGRLSFFERTFDHSMGLATSKNGEKLLLGSRFQLWHFSNAGPTMTQTHGPYDKVYIPHVGYTTGSCDVHDLGIDKQGNIIFVNTLFNCLATTTENKSFEAVWKPPFISDLVPEDRCHLNGLAFRDEEPRYVTGFYQTNEKEGWRQHRQDGGFVMDIKTNEVLCEGLSMPHSPRWYENKLWVINSGAGEFGYIDEATKSFKVIAHCRGYARGLSFHGPIALIGLSKPRDNENFKGLPLENRLAEKKLEPLCGLQWVDIRSGNSEIAMSADMIDEIYDVILLPNTRRPMLVGFTGPEIRQYIKFDGKALDKVEQNVLRDETAPKNSESPLSETAMPKQVSTVSNKASPSRESFFQQQSKQPNNEESNNKESCSYRLARFWKESFALRIGVNVAVTAVTAVTAVAIASHASESPQCRIS